MAWTCEEATAWFIPEREPAEALKARSRVLIQFSAERLVAVFGPLEKGFVLRIFNCYWSELTGEGFNEHAQEFQVLACSIYVNAALDYEAVEGER